MRDIALILQDKGVVGAGGAGFPTYFKLKGKFDTLIINGAECEPLLKKDRYLMKTYPELLANTLNHLVLKAAAIKGILALKGVYKDEIKALEPYFEDGISLHYLRNYYPAGDEQEILYSVLGKSVPPGGLPLDLGVVVMNVETLYNVYRAINNNQPVVDKYVTVSGAVKNPATFKVPLGIPISHLVEAAGGATVERYAILEGGVMTGKLVLSQQEAIKKTTAGIIVLPEGHPALDRRIREIKGMIALASSACTQCRMCTDLCPRYLLGHPLEPHKIMRTTYHIDWGTLADMKTAFLCCDCGICELYACPIGISPRTIIQQIVAQLSAKGIKPEKGEPTKPLIEKTYRRVPKQRLEERLELMEFEKQGAPFKEVEFQPEEVNISIYDHIGVPAIPEVEIGNKVKRGDRIAKPPEKKLSVGYHSSIDGEVVEIKDNIIKIRRA